MRNLNFSFILLLVLHLIPLDTKSQEGLSSGLELVGGIGASWFDNSTKENYMQIYNSQFNTNIESFRTEVKPGTFLTGELRLFNQGNRFRFAGYVSYSQYSVVTQSNVERTSLGWTQLKEKRTGSNYLFGMGLNFQYLVFHQNNHYLSPFLGIGIERNVFYRIHYDQEIKFNLGQEITANQLTEYGRYRLLERFYYGRIDAGFHYLYYTGRISPFAELGGRYLTKSKESSHQSSENYWTMYLNLGLRFSFK
ncbi:MAG: hypothetical protein EA362_09965 [Saprospirales bacterium]|nr:MAG: hypothetical protein EA362_09965 [Saprospirales bacterium]